MYSEDLRPGDMLLSRKYIPFSFSPKQALAHFTNKSIEWYQRKRLGYKRETNCNHVRFVVCSLEEFIHFLEEKDNLTKVAFAYLKLAYQRRALLIIQQRLGYIEEPPKELILFEFTWPEAHFVPLAKWMLNPDYVHIYRYHTAPANPKKLLEICFEWKKTQYDWLQLLGIALNQEWLQLNRTKNEVCSTGMRKCLEAYHETDLFPGLPIWKTPPAAFGNHKDMLRLCPSDKPEEQHQRHEIASVEPKPFILKEEK